MQKIMTDNSPWLHITAGSDIAEMLLEAGLMDDFNNDIGAWIFHTACSKGHQKIVKLYTIKALILTLQTVLVISPDFCLSSWSERNN